MNDGLDLTLNLHLKRLHVFVEEPEVLNVELLGILITAVDKELSAKNTDQRSDSEVFESVGDSVLQIFEETR